MTVPQDKDSAPAASETLEVFDARAHAAELAESAEYPPLAFIDMSGETLQLPHPGTLMSGTAKRLRLAYAAEDEELAETILDEIAPGIPAALDEMPAATVGELMQRWYELIGVDDDEEANTAPKSSSQRSKRKKGKRR